jgi:hypothetical protein
MEKFISNYLFLTPRTPYKMDARIDTLRSIAAELLEKIAPVMMHDFWEEVCEQSLEVFDRTAIEYSRPATKEEQVIFWAETIIKYQRELAKKKG